LVQSGLVEPADVFDDRQLELAAGAPDSVGDELGSEAIAVLVDVPVRSAVVGSPGRNP
jgi:hypothetical protein